MVYVGSKRRIAKDIVPIIQSYITDKATMYIEPFVGGGNTIQRINFHTKIGYDTDKYVIALLRYCRDNGESINPLITREEYNRVKDNRDDYPDWYVGLVGYLTTFGSKFFGGYGLHKKGDEESRVGYATIKNFKKEQDSLVGCNFICEDYRNIDTSLWKNCVIYCDPPYRDTLKYKSSNNFDYDFYYNWCIQLSQNNTVLMSEYDMPKEFKCIWQKDLNCGITSLVDKQIRTEKLFVVR